MLTDSIPARPDTITLAAALSPLRRADWAEVREVLALLPGTPTADLIEQAISGLMAYLAIEKDLPDNVDEPSVPPSRRRGRARAG